MIKLKKDFLRGSYPPVVTPFKNGKVDYDTFAKVVNYMIKNGTHGILVTGTTGEPSTLTTDERIRLYRTAVEVTDGRVPVVAATGSQSEAETIVLSDATVETVYGNMPTFGLAQVTGAVPAKHRGQTARTRMTGADVEAPAVEPY